MRFPAEIPSVRMNRPCLASCHERGRISPEMHLTPTSTSESHECGHHERIALCGDDDIGVLSLDRHLELVQ